VKLSEMCDVIVGLDVHLKFPNSLSPLPLLP